MDELKLFNGEYQDATGSSLNFTVIASDQEEAKDKFWRELANVAGASLEDLANIYSIIWIEEVESGVWIED